MISKTDASVNGRRLVLSFIRSVMLVFAIGLAHLARLAGLARLVLFFVLFQALAFAPCILKNTFKISGSNNFPDNSSISANASSKGHACL